MTSVETFVLSVFVRRFVQHRIHRFRIQTFRMGQLQDFVQPAVHADAETQFVYRGRIGISPK